MFKKFFDIFLIVFFSPIWLPIFCLVCLIVLISSGFPIFYWSKRVGQNGVFFSMPKFRTMKLNTPTVPTAMLEDPTQYLTAIGSFLRKTSLDELPQLISIIRGQMSLVGPRPALFNQKELIGLRVVKGVDALKPGLTGWAQINGRDNLSDEQKISHDYEYLQNQSFLLDMKIIWLTLIKVIKADGVAH